MKSTYLSENSCSRLNVIYFHILEGIWTECLEAAQCLVFSSFWSVVILLLDSALYSEFKVCFGSFVAWIMELCNFSNIWGGGIVQISLEGLSGGRHWHKQRVWDSWRFWLSH